MAIPDFHTLMLPVLEHSRRMAQNIRYAMHGRYSRSDSDLRNKIERLCCPAGGSLCSTTA